jgi:hypothetical protein
MTMGRPKRIGTLPMESPREAGLRSMKRDLITGRWFLSGNPSGLTPLVPLT